MIDLPAPLPDGERILWEGAPRPLSFLRQIFHPQILAGYVGVLLGWCMVNGLRAGTPGAAALAAGKYLALSSVAFLLLAGLARLQAGSTSYIITNRRVMLTFGAALGKTLQIPFTVIGAVSLRTHADSTGDLVLTLLPGNRVNFLILWPHTRPWHVLRAEPMLRALPDADHAARILGRALAAEAGTAPVALQDAQPIARPGDMVAAA